MSNSSLVSYVKISPNRNSPRNHKIDTITIHCVVGQLTCAQIGSIFQNTNAGHRASCNYCVDKDGKIGMFVEEKDRSWCTSSSSNDHRAITIEVACDATHPYAVRDNVYNALIKLVADICKRNRIKKLIWKGDKSLIGQVDKQNMTVHRWFANKACPGQYLYDRQGDIANKVNALLGISSSSGSTNSNTNSNSNTSSSSTNYRVRIKINNLRVRSGPGTSYKTNGMAQPGVYTIIQESTGTGANKWGKLKSGAGWVSLDYCEKL